MIYCEFSLSTIKIAYKWEIQDSHTLEIFRNFCSRSFSFGLNVYENSNFTYLYIHFLCLLMMSSRKENSLMT